MPISEGSPAPDFSLPSTDGREISLQSCKGKKIVLYFYPKDDTPGCTLEACNFRDSIKDFRKNRAVVLGVSPDDLESHKKFQTKFKLPFVLLSDTNHALAEKYGVWKEKAMYGKKYMGIERTTVVIDSLGKIHRIFPKVKVDQHHQEVLAALASAV